MKKFDDINHTFVIAEVGSNWKVGSLPKDIEQCKKLIDIAKKCDADAVKFQIYRAETTYAKNSGQAEYLQENGIKEGINEIFERNSMPYNMIEKIAKYCEEKKIMFMASPFSVQDAKELDPYVEIYKVASFEINHIRLLEFLIKTKKPLIISTGASTYNEIDFVMSFLKENNAKNKIALLQCTSCYPAPLESLNLRTISNLKERYNIAIGFSDHSIEPLIGPLVAIGQGATIIEKHFTIDRNLPGPDHGFALEPKELMLMIKAIRKADRTKGNGEKKILNEELELRKFATRSIQAIKDIKKGDILKEGINFEVLRSGNRKRGTEPRFLKDVEGKKSSLDIKEGDGIVDYE